MRKIIAVSLLLAFLSQPCGEARPARSFSYDELQQEADVIALLQVTNIDVSFQNPEDYRIEKSYQAYTANCSVVSVFKGSASEKISLLFFQHPDGLPGFNGVIVAPFFEELTVLEGARTAYLAYLKNDGAGGLMPVSGHLDAGFSIKAVPWSMHYVPHFSVLQPRDESGKPIERTAETQEEAGKKRREHLDK